MVKINPDVSASNGKIPAVCVPTDNFKTPDESLHLSYKLQLNVKVLEKFTSDSEGKFCKQIRISSSMNKNDFFFLIYQQTLPNPYRNGTNLKT